jgi:hypothetical protein
MRIRILTIAAAAVLASAGNITAQTTEGRVFIAVNGGYQATTNDFSDGASFQENQEDGRFDTDYTVKSGPAFDAAGGVMLSRHFGVGGAVSRFSATTSGTLTGSVPHPFFFSRPRSVNGEVGGLTREELALHMQARGVFSAGQRMEVTMFGGPSWFQVKQGLVMDFDYSNTYPYDEATFTHAQTTTMKKSQLGFNAGLDVAFFFTRQLGVGITTQFAGTSLEIPSADGGTRKIKAGGAQAGGGLRLRF